MPQAAAIVDLFAAEFGPVSVGWAKEGRMEKGSPMQAGLALNAKDWAALSRKLQKPEEEKHEKPVRKAMPR